MSHPKLPVLGTISSSYRVLASNLALYVRLSYIPLLILLVVGISSLYVEPPETRQLLAFGYQVLIPVLMIPTITSWHRLILRGPDHADARLQYRYGVEEWLYLKTLLVLVIALYLFHIVLSMLFGLAFISALSKVMDEGAVLPIYGFLSAIIIFLIFCRFLLVLPAAALGKRMRVASSSTLMIGNVWRLSATYFLALLIPEILVALIGRPPALLVGGLASNAAISIVSVIASVILTVVFYMLSVGVVSYAYKALVLDVESQTIATA